MLRRRRPLDDHFEGEHAHPGLPALADRDRALVRMLVATVLRRLGTLRHLLDSSSTAAFRTTRRASKRCCWSAPRRSSGSTCRIMPPSTSPCGWPRPTAARRAMPASSTRCCGASRANAPAMSAPNPALDTPAWLMARWRKTYGGDIARAIADAHGHEPPLDLTVKNDPQSWAARLRGRVLPTGTVRLIAHGPVSLLPGYTEGAWWVQDAAAALPARLLGDVRGLTRRRPVRRTRRQDRAARARRRAGHGGRSLTAGSPGSRTISRGWRLPPTSLRPMSSNGRAGPFDAVLLDAPCSSTGTIRRHPDIAELKRDEDIAALVTLQRQLIDRAVALTRPGGTLVYCTCSLEPEEGEAQIAALLAREPGVRRSPIAAAEVGGLRRVRHRRRAICAPCPATCPIPTRAWPVSTASMPPVCSGCEALGSRAGPRAAASGPSLMSGLRSKSMA